MSNIAIDIMINIFDSNPMKKESTKIFPEYLWTFLRCKNGERSFWNIEKNTHKMVTHVSTKLKINYM